MGVLTHRVAHFNEDVNEDRLATAIDLSEEKMLNVVVKVATYQHRIVNLYNKKVGPYAFTEGNWFFVELPRTL